MKLHKASFAFSLFVGGLLLCSGITGTQTADGILSFDSKITVDRDRTIHVQEKFEIANENGLFDGGIHRRLLIKSVSPQRVKTGSFEAVAAKVDGEPAAVSTSEDGRFFDIRIATVAGTLSRGNHVIDLSYTALHQFAIYKNFEDLNQEITGEWPVSVEKATVELSFPDKLPEDAGISANTGTDSKFQFDCVRTDLPSGVRFETSHSLPTGDHLLISGRFPHSGYFVSNVKEDGFRAFKENHPLFVPGLVSFCGLIAFAAIGAFVWIRASGKVDAISPIPAQVSPTFWREVISTYAFPLVMFAFAIIPGLNFTYSGHGGICWFFVPLCFPWVIVRILVKIAKGTAASSKWYKRFFKITIPSYVAIALPLSCAAVTSIHTSFGLSVSAWAFFAVMVSPFPWFYFT